MSELNDLFIGMDRVEETVKRCETSVFICKEKLDDVETEVYLLKLDLKDAEKNLKAWSEILEMCGPDDFLLPDYNLDEFCERSGYRKEVFTESIEILGVKYWYVRI